MATRVVRAEFVKSAAQPKDWPPDEWPEVAFCGRSNVGKSTLINHLCDRRGLCRTSRTPGRTRLTNFFVVELDEEVRRTLQLVDLPGFGYANVSKSERATWRPSIEAYLAQRKSLRVVALLVDARRIPFRAGAATDDDPLFDERELLPWIASRGVTVIPVVTKGDKLSKHERPLVAAAAKAIFGVAPVVTSAEANEGRDALWQRILRGFDAPNPAA